MKPEAKKLNEVISGVRLSFNLARARADEMHRDLGATSAMRAVMESLAGGGEMTVPQIARTKSVSRQHIQLIVNRLTGENLVEVRDNPADKRTYLVFLNEHGRGLFEEIRRREMHELERLSAAFTGNELEVAQTVLSKLNDALKDTMKGTEND